MKIDKARKRAGITRCNLPHLTMPRRALRTGGKGRERGVIPLAIEESGSRSLERKPS